MRGPFLRLLSMKIRMGLTDDPSPGNRPTTSAVSTSSLTIATLSLLGLAAMAVAGEPTKIDFNRDVRTILSDKCFLCHGPDEAGRKAGLRLDERESAIAVGAIVPGDPEWSELVARVTSDDPDTVMPPPSMEKPITPDEAAVLKRWIDEGADYSEHWAFVPPTRPRSPEVSEQ